MSNVQANEKFIKSFTVIMNLLIKRNDKSMPKATLLVNIERELQITEEQAKAFYDLLWKHGYLQGVKQNDYWVITVTKKACDLIRMMREHNKKVGA